MIQLIKTVYLFVLFGAFFILCSSADAADRQVNCSDHNVRHSPFMAGIERVVIGSALTPSSYDKEKLPEILRKNNLENLFLELHTELFKVEEKYGYGCGDKRNQKVEILDLSGSLERQAFRQNLEDPKALLVFIAPVVHHAEELGYPTGEDFVSVSVNILINGVSDIYKNSPPFLFPISMDSKMIEDKLRSEFRNIAAP